MATNWTKDKNQSGTIPGFTKYQFLTRVQGKRIRERVTCQPHEVHIFYARWVETKTGELKDENGTLFIRFQEYLSRHVKQKKSVLQYEVELNFFDRLKDYYGHVDVPLRSVKSKDIAEYLEWRSEHRGREGKIKPTSLNKDLNCLSSFFKWCIKNDLYDRVNPCFGNRVSDDSQRDINVPLKDAQEIIEKSSVNKALECFVMIALYTGLRKREIMSLTWDCVDWDRREMIVKAQTTKTKKKRIAMLPDELISYLQTLERTSDKIIPGSVMTVRRFWYQIRKTFSFNQFLDVRNLTLHDLRHIYAQQLRNQSLPGQDIVAAMGHSSYDMSFKRYAQSMGDGSKQIVQKMSYFVANVPQKSEKVQ